MECASGEYRRDGIRRPRKNKHLWERASFGLHLPADVFAERESQLEYGIETLAWGPKSHTIS